MARITLLMGGIIWPWKLFLNKRNCMAKKLFELLKDEVPKSELVDSLVEKIKETNDEIFKHKIILYLIELQRFNKINLVIVNTCYPANSATTIASFSLTNRGLIFDNDYFVVLEDLSDKVLVDKKDELLILIDRILDSEQVLSVVKQMPFFRNRHSYYIRHILFRGHSEYNSQGMQIWN